MWIYRFWFLSFSFAEDKDVTICPSVTEASFTHHFLWRFFDFKKCHSFFFLHATLFFFFNVVQNEVFP